MGWRIIRLMSLTVKSPAAFEGTTRKPSMQNLSSLVIMERLMEAIDAGESDQDLVSPDTQSMSFESRFLQWIKRAFSRGSAWPSSDWIGIILRDARATPDITD